jgi:Fuc2NAc and GlcNAc transferase
MGIDTQMNAQMMLLLFPIAAMLGWVGAFLVAHQGQRIGLLDHPNARSSHARPTPKGGGIGILAAAGAMGVTLGLPWYAWEPAALVATFSVWADRLEIAPSSRLKIHFLTVFIFLFGHTASTIDQLGALLLIIPWAIFVVGTANIYNFMDGINGIAGLSGVVGFSLMAYFVARFQTSGDMFMWYCLLAAACAGFLPLNFPRARVFMGDVGSILLGFLFACAVITSSRSVQDFMCTTSFLFPFYADELTTMFVRLRDSESLTQPHRRHIYQLLANEKGIPHWKVSVGFGLLQLFVGVSAISVKPFGIVPTLALLVALFMAFSCVSFYIRASLEKSPRPG